MPNGKANVILNFFLRSYYISHSFGVLHRIISFFFLETTHQVIEFTKSLDR